MCLSTIYKNSKEENNILCKFVSTINADGDKLIFEDVMGEKTTITGKLVSADLTSGFVIVSGE